MARLMDPQLLEEIARGAADQEIEALARLRLDMAPPPELRIISRFGPIVTCRLRRADILEVRKHPAVRSLKAARTLASDPVESLLDPEAARAHPPPRSGAPRRPGVKETGRGVIVGIIDYGCDIAHHALRKPDGSSRIAWLWDQSGRPGPSGPPEPYGKGRLYNRQEIDAALADQSPYETLNYHPAPSGAPFRGSHGTHVTDIAAGSGLGDAEPGMAPGSDIIFVHVASGDTGGLRNFGDSVGVLEAIDFILGKAQDRPCVISVSLGRHGGPHDGSSLIELACDDLLRRRRGVSMVQSAGNYFGRAIHAEGNLAPSESDTMLWRVPQERSGDVELEIWYARHDRLDVLIEAPDERTRFHLPPGARREITIGGEIVGRAYHRLSDPNNGDNQVDIFLYDNAPAGEWELRLDARRVKDGRWHAWIERDGNSAEQSHFSAGPISPAVTAGTIANGRLPIQVAAHTDWPMARIAPFSSAGPTRDGRPVPLLAAPGVRIRAARSAVPEHANSHREAIRKSGTSMAAPYIAGLVALMFEAAPQASQSEIRQILQETSRPIRHRSGREHMRAAWGAVNPRRALARARRLGRTQSTSSPRSAQGQMPEQTPASQITALEWGLIGHWINRASVPTDGAELLPPQRSVPNERPLPQAPRIAAQYLARALLNARAVRSGGLALPMPSTSQPRPTAPEMLALQILPAVAPSQNDWRALARFIELQTTLNRTAPSGPGTPRLFGTDAVRNRQVLAQHLACQRLQSQSSVTGPHRWCTYPAAPPEPPIRILAQQLEQAGALVDWALVPMTQRRVYIMDQLVRRYGFPAAGAAGIVGNLDRESGLLPERVEGSRAAQPRTAPPMGGGARRRHSASQIMNRSRRPAQGPRLPGVGLAQWTTRARRAGLFAARMGTIAPGAGVLFFMDLQIAYLVSELRQHYRGLNRQLRRRIVTLNDAADGFVYDFERPGALLEDDPTRPGRKRRRPRTDPQVQRVFAERRRAARAALQAYTASIAETQDPPQADHSAPGTPSDHPRTTERAQP